MDAPDWVSWRWLTGTGGALLVLGAWLFFDVADPAWMPLPFLAAHAVPRMRTEPGPPVVGVTLALQNLPALALSTVVVLALIDAGEVPERTRLVVATALFAVGIAHAGWLAVANRRGAVAGAGTALAAWCAALAVSGWLPPMEEGHYVAGVLLLLCGDLVSSLAPDGRTDTWLLPSLILSAFLVVMSLITIAIGEALLQGGVVLATAVVAVPVLAAVKRDARRGARGRRWFPAR